MLGKKDLSHADSCSICFSNFVLPRSSSSARSFQACLIPQLQDVASRSTWCTFVWHCLAECVCDGLAVFHRGLADTSSLSASASWMRWKHNGSAFCCTGRMDSPGVKSCQVTVAFVLVLLMAAAFGIIEQPSQRCFKKLEQFLSFVLSGENNRT